MLNNKEIILDLEGKSFPITMDDVLIERRVKKGFVATTQGGITIALDTTLNDSLLMEGLARELVNKINTQRKHENFAVTDRIIIYVETTLRIQQCFQEYKNYIMGEVLAKEIYFEKTQGTKWCFSEEWMIISLHRA